MESDFDAIAQKAIAALAENRIQVEFIGVPLVQVVSRIKDVVDAGPTLPLPFHKPRSELDRLAPFQDIVTVVNTQLTAQVGREETARLIDMLFSPTLPRWDPFYHNLDFRRTLGNQMLDLLLKPVRVERSLPTFTILGSAASGKTTVAKRLAYDLAVLQLCRSGLISWADAPRTLSLRSFQVATI